MQLRSGLFIWVFTLWFALLQTAAPLMHAHMNSSFDMDDGPHLHVSALHLQQEEPTNSQHAFHWHVHANQDTGMTVGLTPVVTEQGWQVADTAMIWLNWWMPLWLATVLIIARLLVQHRWQRDPLRRPPADYFTSTAPRAPPTA